MTLCRYFFDKFYKLYTEKNLKNYFVFLCGLLYIYTLII